jgi:uncharacterized protein (DUF488 family)
MRIFTIGFTKKSAETFFSLLSGSGAKHLVDVRLNNVSQLAGFAKKDDLKYFLRTICGIDYLHLPELAPTQPMLDAYKKEKGDWAAYEVQFLDLMRSREIEQSLSKEILTNSCLLCSEDKPLHCHRRLVAEYLRDRWKDVEIIHL